MDDAKSSLLKSSLYAKILDKIITGQFPPGHHLAEEDLALTYHVSRTPIREVLFALQKDGLIRRTRYQGAQVVSFGPNELEQIYEIRRSLECLAVRKAIRNLNLNDLLRIERSLVLLNQRAGSKWNQKQAEIDLELHQMIGSHSGNPRLAAYLENISLLIHSLRLVGYQNDEFARKAGEEHLEIVRALLRRDAELVERLLAEHIDHSMRHVLEMFFAGSEKVNVAEKPSIEQQGSKPEPTEIETAGGV